MPGALLDRYLPVPGRSVPFSWVTQNCSGSRAAMASGSLLYRLMRRSPVIGTCPLHVFDGAIFQNQFFETRRMRPKDRLRSRRTDQDLSSGTPVRPSGGDPWAPGHLDRDLGLKKDLAPLGLRGAQRAAGLHMDFLGPRRIRLTARLLFKRRLQGHHRGLGLGMILGSGLKMYAKLAFGGRGDRAGAPDRDPAHHGPYGIGHPSMIRQDHPAAKALAHIRIITRRRGPQPHHRHVQPGLKPYQSMMTAQTTLHQHMPGQAIGRQIEWRLFLGKSSL